MVSKLRRVTDRSKPDRGFKSNSLRDIVSNPYVQFGEDHKSARDVALFCSKRTGESKLTPDPLDLILIVSARGKFGSLQFPGCLPVGVRPFIASSKPTSLQFRLDPKGWSDQAQSEPAQRPSRC